MGQYFTLSNMFDFTEKFLEQNGIFYYCSRPYRRLVQLGERWTRNSEHQAGVRPVKGLNFSDGAAIWI